MWVLAGVFVVVVVLSALVVGMLVARNNKRLVDKAVSLAKDPKQVLK